MIHEAQNPKLKPVAQKLCKDMTKEERHLWYDFLKALPVNVHRQKVIGPYIVDFYSSQGKMVIELDGSQHLEPERRQMDAYFPCGGISSVICFANATFPFGGRLRVMEPAKTR
ncbi:hypothetical protein N510_001528 [Firmicutes bacterium ASF500]|nr:hypothetical protein N510_001528 [Firmicutes bacterium ASF500]